MAPSLAVRMAAALLVLSVVVATVPAHPTPSVMEIRAGWKSRARHSASVAATASASPKDQIYEEGYYEEKEVTLVEVSRRDCSTQQYQFCNNETYCGNPHAQWTSDVACHSDGYRGGYGYGSNSVSDHLWGPHNSIGSCDWTTDYVPRVSVTSNINKWGSASAICYFGADSQECGGPFCDRMVVTLEGAVYYVETAYSHYTSSNTNTDECAVVGFPGILPVFDGVTSGARAVGSAGQRQVRLSASKPASDAAAHTADASIQYGRYHNDDQDTTGTVYSGAAWVINGVVTSLVSGKKDKWGTGLFEYVIDYANPVVVASIDGSIPWVRDKTYKFTFYKDGSYY